jgi:ribosomal protein S8
LEPERSLPQIYSAFLTGEEIKNAVSKANTLLKREVSSASDFTKWARDVHELLSSVSNGEQEEESEDDFSDSSTKKGLISRRAISTYLKQWELFAKEKLGPTFSIEVKENEASPLTNKLNRLESGASRTWTTMLENITEVRTSTVFQKRATVSAERGTITSSTKNLDSYDFDLKGRPLKIQLSPEVGAVTITQFVKAMKAQFLAYSGMGLFTVSLQSGKSVVTVSLPAAVKADLKKIEEFLLELI